MSSKKPRRKLKRKKLVRQKPKQRRSYVIDDDMAQNMIERAISLGWLLWIDCGSWGNRKKLTEDLAKQYFGEDKGAMGGFQRFIDMEPWNEVVLPMKQAQTQARKQSLPWMGKAIHFILQEEADALDARFEKAYKEVFRRFDEEFAPKYPEYIDKFAKEHPKLYKQIMQMGGYPTVESLRARLRFRWGWAVIAPPTGSGKAQVMGRAMAKREELKWRERMKEAGEQAVVKVREAFAEIITHLRDVLTDPGKTFQDTTVEKPKEFLQRLSSINVWGDEPFAKIAKDAEELLDGVYGQDLRDDDEYRKIIGKAVNDVVKKFEDLPVVEMERALDF
jgi:hypothetical protein